MSASFGEWLRRRRKALDLTQGGLAERVGLSASAIRKLESDERRPSRQVAELLGVALELAPQDREPFLRLARAALPPAAVEAEAIPQPPDAHTPPLPENDIRPTEPPPVRLPTPPTALVGRERELGEIGRLLRDPQCRLLTLVGAGGIGKTRLAIHAAAEQQTAFSDGLFFVAMAGAPTAALMAPTIAASIGLSLFGVGNPEEQVLAHLQNKQVLLVLDNLEQLLAAPAEPATSAVQSLYQGSSLPLLEGILQQAPGVKLLATSREQLNLPGEWVFDLQGLPTPPPIAEHQTSGAGLAAYSSVALFLQTARRVQSGFTLAVEEQSAVARLCRLVEGMPLAIELAATWVRTLTCAEIVAELERSIDFLTTQARGAPERHRSMKAVFDHSWRLLTPTEQRALRRLAVFRGGFRRDAAQVVAGASLASLASLVGKSLVRHSTHGRYELHELVRQYAAAHLAIDEREKAATHTQHSDFYLGRLQQQCQALRTAQQAQVLANFIAEADNVRTAWAWLVAQRDGARIRAATLAMIDLYDWLHWFQEGDDIFGRAAAALTSTEGTPLGAALLGQGVFACRFGRYAAAQHLLAASIAHVQECEDAVFMVAARYWQAAVAYNRGDYGQAHQWANESLLLAEQIGDAWRAHADARNLLALIALAQGDYPAAEQMFQQVLRFLRNAGSPSMTIVCLCNLSRALRLQRAFDVAQALLDEALLLCKQVGDRWVTALTLAGLGQLAYEAGSFADAQRRFEESLTLMRTLNETWNTTHVLNGAGYAALALGDLRRAQLRLYESLKLATQAELPPRLLDAMLGLAQLAAAMGNSPHALTLTLHTLCHPAAPQEIRLRAERLRTSLANDVAPDELAQIEASVAATPLADVVSTLLFNANID
ncbi:MAG: tetratricopeptide repeat protein [Caldilineaceae bacterium]|nr:tetratricopeptide repeat protein [Caldilineaceae bacterium]